MTERRRRYTRWTKEEILRELAVLCQQHGFFPTDTDLKHWNREGLRKAIQASDLSWPEWSLFFPETPPKPSAMGRGLEFEYLVKDLIEARGYSVIHTKEKVPYDLLVEGLVRVEVKSRIKKPSGYWSFEFGDKGVEREFHVAFLFCRPQIVATPTDYESLLIVPKHEVAHKGVTVTPADRWMQYKNAWEVFDAVMEDVCNAASLDLR